MKAKEVFCNAQHELDEALIKNTHFIKPDIFSMNIQQLIFLAYIQHISSIVCAHFQKNGFVFKYIKCKIHFWSFGQDSVL